MNTARRCTRCDKTIMLKNRGKDVATGEIIWLWCALNIPSQADYVCIKGLYHLPAEGEL